MQRGQSDRLKDNFVEVLRQQAIEAVHLAAEAGQDPDVREALHDILVRTRDAARSLGLDAVERAAAQAVRAVDEGAGGTEAVERLLETCRALDGISPVLRPVIVVAATADQEPRLRAQAEGLAVAVHVVPATPDALHRARTEAPAAVVLPATELASALQEGEDLHGLPVYVYGDEGDLAHRLRAARLGAAGYLPAPLDLRDAVPRIRHRLSADPPTPFRVLLVDDDEARAEAVARQLEDEHVQVSHLADPYGLLRALDGAVPDLVAISMAIQGGVSATELVAVLRGHHRYGDVPRVLLADDAAAEGRGLLADAEAVLRRDADASLLHARIHALLERSRRERALRALDPATGVLTRAAVMRAADRELAAVRRTRTTLAFARVDLDDAMRLRAEIGRPSVDAALRHLARALRDMLRETDVVGHIGLNGFVALLPACTAANAHARMDAVLHRYRELVANDDVLADTWLVTGVSDTTAGLEDALLRADRDLLATRAKGARPPEGP